MGEQFFIDALNENKESIKAHVRQTILDGITQQFKWELPEVIKKTISEFMANEIAPEIKKQLINDKALIVESATDAVKGIAVEIGKCLQKEVASNLTTSYRVRDLAKAIFGY